MDENADEREKLFRVAAHEFEVRFDVGTKTSARRRGRIHTSGHEFASELEYRRGNFADEFFLAREVIGDNTFTDTGTLRNFFEGSAGVTGLSDQFDCAIDDLGATRFR